MGSGVLVCVLGPVTAWGRVGGDPPDFNLVVSASWAPGALGPSPQVNSLMGWVGAGSGVLEAPPSPLSHRHSGD